MQSKNKILIWIVFLALMAGCVNAVAIFGCEGIAVSNITGMISKSTISISSGETVGLTELLSIIVLFFVGAIAAGIATGESISSSQNKWHYHICHWNIDSYSAFFERTA